MLIILSWRPKGGGRGHGPPKYAPAANSLHTSAQYNEYIMKKFLIGQFSELAKGSLIRNSEEFQTKHQRKRCRFNFKFL